MLALAAKSEPLTCMPLAHQQLRQAAHADAADADEVVGGVLVLLRNFVGNAHP